MSRAIRRRAGSDDPEPRAGAIDGTRLPLARSPRFATRLALVGGRP